MLPAILEYPAGHCLHSVADGFISSLYLPAGQSRNVQGLDSFTTVGHSMNEPCGISTNEVNPFEMTVPFCFGKQSVAWGVF